MAVYANIVQEASFLKKATVGLKINKGIKDFNEEVIKAHKHEGYLRYVQNCNDIDMLDYLQKDLSSATGSLDTLADRIEQVEKYPDLQTNWSKAIKKQYVDKGVKASDVRAYNKWLKEVLRPAISQRKKELKAKNK